MFWIRACVEQHCRWATNDRGITHGQTVDDIPRRVYRPRNDCPTAGNATARRRRVRAQTVTSFRAAQRNVKTRLSAETVNPRDDGPRV